MTLGQIAFLGSGETSLAGGRVFEALARALPQSLRIAVLETPAGFELNSHQVAGKVADFLKTRLANYTPIIDVVSARKRGTPFSPDEAEIVRPLLYADLIFMGPGSPTYATRQLKDSAGMGNHPRPSSPRRDAGICFRGDDLHRRVGYPCV